jgi:hypothetical protein
VPHPLVQDGPSGRVHEQERGAVDQSWVCAVHQRDAQDEAANAAVGVLLTVGAETANKCKNLVSAYFLDSTDVIKVINAADNDDVTIVTSNLAAKSSQKEQLQPTSLAALAKILFGNPKLQYLNAITIATNLAVTDMGATSIFVTDGVDVENKRLATKPLTVNLPDGRKIKSTHVCNIKIPGLPVILMGHIIPDLKIASLIGIRPLCKVGCKVIFDNEKCDVVCEGNIILQGYKDPTTDLWTLPITKKGMRTTPSQNNLPQPCTRIGHAPHPPMAQQERALFLHSV